MTTKTDLADLAANLLGIPPQPSLIEDLEHLRDHLASMRDRHGAEIAKTVHRIWRDTHTTAFPLAGSLDGIEDHILDAIDTYNGAHGLGEYAEPSKAETWQEQAERDYRASVL